MRIVLVIGFAALALLAKPLFASAAYCGPAADGKAVEQAAIKQFGHKIDKTYIMNVDVIGSWARADISYAGQASEYFNKVNGAWTFKGYFPPKNLPASIDRSLNARAYPHCRNPKFMPRGSG